MQEAGFVRKMMLIRQAEKMLAEGAAILDLGGLSSRPGAVKFLWMRKLERVVPAIKLVSDKISRCYYFG